MQICRVFFHNRSMTVLVNVRNRGAFCQSAFGLGFPRGNDRERVVSGRSQRKSERVAQADKQRSREQILSDLSGAIYASSRYFDVSARRVAQPDIRPALEQHAQAGQCQSVPYTPPPPAPGRSCRVRRYAPCRLLAPVPNLSWQSRCPLPTCKPSCSHPRSVWPAPKRATMAEKPEPIGQASGAKIVGPQRSTSR